MHCANFAVFVVFLIEIVIKKSYVSTLVVELTPGLLEMRRPQSRNIQTTVKDVLFRTLLAHSAH